MGVLQKANKFQRIHKERQRLGDEKRKAHKLLDMATSKLEKESAKVDQRKSKVLALIEDDYDVETRSLDDSLALEVNFATKAKNSRFVKCVEMKHARDTVVK